MSHKQDIVDQAIKGLEDGGYPGAALLAPLLERVYQCGHNEAGRMYRDEIEFLKQRLEEYMLTINMLLPKGKPNIVLHPQYSRGCSICGIGTNGEVMGYVCPRHNCPTKVTC